MPKTSGNTVSYSTATKGAAGSGAARNERVAAASTTKPKGK